MPGLDDTCNRPGYLLGRLFSILIDLEATATGKHPQDTDMFGRMPTAVGNPAVVLTHAIQAKRWIVRVQQVTAQRVAGEDHAQARGLAKADRYTRRIDELVQRIGQPGTLTGKTEEQSLFITGYHHQVAGDTETMPTRAVAELLGYTNVNAARAELSRLGVEAIGRDRETGEKLWPAWVAEIVKNRPGRGARTDLVPPVSIQDWTPGSDPTLVEITAALIGAGIDPDAIDARPDGVVYVGVVALGQDGKTEDGDRWWTAVDTSNDHYVSEGTSLAEMAAAVARTRPHPVA